MPVAHRSRSDTRWRIRCQTPSSGRDLWEQARAALEEWVASGRLRTREDIAEGLENALAAFIGLLQGRNQGKQLVRLS